MKAMVQDTYGGSDALLLRDVADPAPKRKLRRLIGGWVGESLVVEGLTADGLSESVAM